MALILLVEDDVQLRSAARRVLEMQGYDVLEAGDSHEARVLMERSEERPDVAVFDLVLPGLGGRELANSLLAHNPDLKVVFTSGYSSREAAQLASAERFLKKPYSVPELLAVVEEVLKG